MNSPIEYASFLIRLWREPSTYSDAATVWRGEVIHVQSGGHRAVNDLATLLTFLREQSGDANLLSAASRGSRDAQSLTASND